MKRCRLMLGFNYYESGGTDDWWMAGEEHMQVSLTGCCLADKSDRWTA